MGIFRGKKKRRPAPSPPPDIKPQPQPIPTPIPEPLQRPVLGHPREWVGIGTHELNEPDMGLIRGLGIKHVRYTLYWQLWVENPHYAITWEHQVRALMAMGVEPLIVVHGDNQNDWGGWNNRGQVLANFLHFMVARVRQFPGLTWQPWNESEAGFTDLFGSLGKHGTMRDRGKWYGEHLDGLYRAMKTADPTCTVVTQGVASHAEQDEWIEGLLSTGAPFDALCLHRYGYPSAPGALQAGEDALRALKESGRNVPVWLTEFGFAREEASWLDGPGADAAQVKQWQEVLTGNAQRRVYARCYGYQLWTRDGYGHGIVREDRSPRPTYRWLQDHLR